jgi:hypothetical protein
MTEWLAILGFAGLFLLFGLTARGSARACGGGRDGCPGGGSICDACGAARGGGGSRDDGA